MSNLKSLVSPEIKIKFNDEEWKVEFKLRNFGALKNKCNISENDLLQGLIKGDVRIIPYAIWTATLVFAPFDPLEPLKIEKEIELEELFNLNMSELKEITDKVVLAMEAYLPKGPNGATEKKPVTAKKTPKKAQKKRTK